jgi:hypothetical protein
MTQINLRPQAAPARQSDAAAPVRSAGEDARLTDGAVLRQVPGRKPPDQRFARLSDDAGFSRQTPGEAGRRAAGKSGAVSPSEIRPEDRVAAELTGAQRSLRGRVSPEAYRQGLAQVLGAEVPEHCLDLRDSVADSLLLKPFMSALTEVYANVDVYGGEAGVRAGEEAAVRAGEFSRHFSEATQAETAQAAEAAGSALLADCDALLEQPGLSPETRSMLLESRDALQSTLGRRLAVLRTMEEQAGDGAAAAPLLECCRNLEAAESGSAAPLASLRAFERIAPLASAYLEAGAALRDAPAQLLSRYKDGDAGALDSLRELLAAAPAFLSGLARQGETAALPGLQAALEVGSLALRGAEEDLGLAGKLSAKSAGLLAGLQGSQPELSAAEAVSFLDESRQSLEALRNHGNLPQAELDKVESAINELGRVLADKQENFRASVLANADAPRLTPEAKLDLLTAAGENPLCSESFRAELSSLIQEETDKACVALAGRVAPRLEQAAAQTARARTPQGLSVENRAAAMSRLDEELGGLRRELADLERKSADLDAESGLSAAQKSARLNFYAACTEKLREHITSLEQCKSDLMLAKYERAAESRLSPERMLGKSAGALLRKIETASLSRAEKEELLRAVESGSLTPKQREVLLKNLDAFLTGSYKRRVAGSALEHLRAAAPGAVVPEADRSVLRTAIGFILSTEDRDALLPTLAERSRESVAELEAELERLTPASTPAERRNLGARLAVLGDRAAQVLLPEQAAAFQEKLGQLLGAKSPESIREFMGAEALDALNPAQRDTLERLARASFLNPRLLELLGGLEPGERTAFLDALGQDPGKAAEVLDKLMLARPDLDELCLALKLEALAGTFRTDRTADAAPPTGADLFSLRAGHDSARMARELRRLMRNEMERLPEGNAQKIHLQGMLGQSDAALLGQFASRVASGEATPGSLDYFVVRAYCLQLSAKAGRQLSSAELQQDGSLSRFSRETLDAAQKGLADERSWDNALGSLSSIASNWDRTRWSSRAANFFGALLHRDLSTERLNQRALRGLLQAPGFQEAGEIALSHVRETLGVATGASIDTSDPRVIARVLQSTPHRAGSSSPGVQLQRAGETARVRGGRTQMEKAYVDVLEARGGGANAANMAGATGALGILAIEEVLEQDESVTWSKKRDQLAGIKLPGSSGKPFDPLAMTTMKGARGGIQDKFYQNLKRLQTASTEAEFNAALEEMKDLYAANSLHERALVTIRHKDASQSMVEKLRRVIGKNQPGLIDTMNEKYAPLLGVAPPPARTPDRWFTRSTRRHMDMAADMAVLAVFREQNPPLSFGAFMERLDNPESLEFRACADRLRDALCNAEFSTRSHGMVKPQVGEPWVEALAGWAVTSFVNNTEVQGRDDYLQNAADSARVVNETRLMQKSFGEAAANDYNKFQVQELSADLVDRLPPNSRFSLDSEVGGGVSVETGLAADMEVSLDVAMRKGLVVERDKDGRMSVYLSRELSAEVKAKVGVSFLLDQVGVEAEAGVGVSGASGVKLSFESPEQCKEFLGSLLNGECSAEMMQLFSEARPIRETGGKVTLEAKASVNPATLDLVGKAANAARGARPDFRPMLDLGLSLQLSASGTRKTERPRGDMLTVSNTVKTSAELSATAVMAGRELVDNDALKLEGSFEATLTRQYTGGSLTGATMTRVFTLEADGGVEKAAAILENFGVKNQALLDDLTLMLEGGQDVTFSLEAELTEEGLRKYEAEGNMLGRGVTLADRNNYSSSKVTLSLPVAKRDLELSLEIPDEVGFVTEALSLVNVGVRVHINSNGSLTRDFDYRPLAA